MVHKLEKETEKKMKEFDTWVGLVHKKKKMYITFQGQVYSVPKRLEGVFKEIFKKKR